MSEGEFERGFASKEVRMWPTAAPPKAAT